jgi:amidase
MSRNARRDADGPAVGRTATDLAGDVRAGRRTARDVVDAHLDHLTAVEHRLGAFVAVRRQAALEDAATLDGRGDLDELPLAGVPVAVKDVVDVAGEPTRHGSRATSATPAATHDPLVGRLRDAGAVVVGKTRCPELSLWGTSDDPAGTAVSPWDPTRTAGGSSGGSAAAVAAGVVPIALASDGLGSVRIPAAATGCVGLKPGAERLPVTLSGEPHWFGLSRYGPIATSVRDLALAYDVLADADTSSRLAPPTERLSVAVSWRSPFPGTTVTRAWVDAALEVGRLLRHLGHDVRRQDPGYDQAMVTAITARWLQGAARDVDLLGLDPGELQPRTRGHVTAGRRLARVAPVDAEQAIRWRERVLPLFEEHDVLVTPAFARTPPVAASWHGRSWAANVAVNVNAYPFTSPWNLADLPAMVVPVRGEGGQPRSAQLVAGPGREELLLGVALQLESLAPWPRHAPGWGVSTAPVG